MFWKFNQNLNRGKSRIKHIILCQATETLTKEFTKLCTLVNYVNIDIAIAYHTLIDKDF